MTSSSEYEYEPVPGLPERLPAGEELLWQGAPRWQSMARHAFHARKVALYFLALLLLHLVWVLTGGQPLAKALTGALQLALPAALAVGLLALLARAMSRAAVYTITNRRVVLRFGVAIEIAVNLPFSQIASAALLDHGDGTGDISLTLAERGYASYAVLWPHARPWAFSPAQPTLRCIPDGAKVAAILAAALKAALAKAGPAATLATDAFSDRPVAGAPPNGDAQPSSPVEPPAGAAIH